ncbi:hypothetical protein A3E10_01070 [Candidatus Roizmanbacteria bacterium RIFCSPHIGHO2_12_FULL_37_23]|nr:MAG: hypothetical protein A3E10_01070 [Candidatus Roizmanbacteria bacterium RIFCSPHIGHO2_12_FULL_37_23]
MPIDTKSFVAPNDPILIRKADPIEARDIQSTEVRNIIESMLDIAYGHQEDRSKAFLIGLAAPQVGVSKRIILVDVTADGKGVVGDLKVFINPEITWQSDETEEWYEGCWSTDKVCGIVASPSKVRVKAYTENGTIMEEEYTGYTARIFRHEIDHLNGREFVQRITDDNKLHWVEDDDWEAYRNNQGWRNWPKKCPREKWNKIKGDRS